MASDTFYDATDALVLALTEAGYYGQQRLFNMITTQVVSKLESKVYVVKLHYSQGESGSYVVNLKNKKVPHFQGYQNH